MNGQLMPIIDEQLAKIILAYLEGDEPDDMPKTVAALDLLVEVSAGRS